LTTRGKFFIFAAANLKKKKEEKKKKRRRERKEKKRREKGKRFNFRIAAILACSTMKLTKHLKAFAHS